jgi:hypothetical protein
MFAATMRATMPSSASGSERLLRLLCFLLCVPSGLALLLKAYGVAQMRPFTLSAVIPCAVLLLAIWWISRRRFPLLASDLLIGAVAGLIGAVAYDVVRIPALFAGYRVYDTISVFGLWLLDAEKSSRFTELAGWSYNYCNGITFGMMYAVFMRGRHWIFGVLWAIFLESLAVFTPVGQIFSLRGNWPVLGIAFSAHIAYGYPLGRAVQRWRDTKSALGEMPPVVRYVTALVGLLVLIHPLLSPGQIAADRRARQGELRVEGISLNPAWLRLKNAGPVIISNPQNRAAAVVLKELNVRMVLQPGDSAKSPPLAPGIYQFFVETPGRTHSSFVLVEPVEQSR